MRVKIVTKDHEYQGLYFDTVIENASYVNDDTITFKHSGKDWVIARDDVVFVGSAEIYTANTTNPPSALDKQVSGGHYKGCKIQPVEYIQANGLDYFQGNVIKYTTRHKLKNGKADIEKAIHYLELILELQYGD